MQEIQDIWLSVEYAPYAVVLSSILMVVVHRVYWHHPHKREKNMREGMLNTHIIGHRGSKIEGLPENSIAAFKDAIKAGVTTIEFDVWLTQDGFIVVHHDETLNRMSGGVCDKKINEVAYKDLPQLSPKDHDQKDRCDQFSKDETNAIPLFEDVIKLLVQSPHVSMIIEFKQDNDQLISKVDEILGKHKKQDSIFWFSLEDKINQKLREFNPSIPTITSIQSMLNILLLYYAGILPFVDIEDAVFGITVDEISLEQIQQEKALKNFPEWFKLFLSYVFIGKPPTMMVAPGLFAHLRKRGVPVWFLGVNEEVELDLAITTGATGVLTDRPNWACHMMRNKTQTGRVFQEIK